MWAATGFLEVSCADAGLRDRC